MSCEFVYVMRISGCLPRIPVFPAQIGREFIISSRICWKFSSSKILIVSSEQIQKATRSLLYTRSVIRIQ